MNFLASMCFTFSGMFAGTAMAHVYDVHPRGPEEMIMDQEYRKKKENDRAERILNDKSKSEDERRDALYILVKNEKMV